MCHWTIAMLYFTHCNNPYEPDIHLNNTQDLSSVPTSQPTGQCPLKEKEVFTVRTTYNTWTNCQHRTHNSWTLQHLVYTPYHTMLYRVTSFHPPQKHTSPVVEQSGDLQYFIHIKVTHLCRQCTVPTDAYIYAWFMYRTIMLWTAQMGWTKEWKANDRKWLWYNTRCWSGIHLIGLRRWYKFLLGQSVSTSWTALDPSIHGMCHLMNQDVYTTSHQSRGYSCLTSSDTFLK